MLVLLLASGSAAAHVRTKKRPHKSRAVATKHAESALRTPPEPIAHPIAPLSVLLVTLAAVVATAFVSFVGAMSPARGGECESHMPAHAGVHSRSVTSVGVAAAQRFRFNGHQLGKAGLPTLP
jgi:hypothetical protein